MSKLKTIVCIMVCLSVIMVGLEPISALQADENIVEQEDFR